MRAKSTFWTKDNFEMLSKFNVISIHDVNPLQQVIPVKRQW